MSEILFLAHRLPFPPDRGDKIRSHHVLKALAQIAPVHVGCLAESADDFAHEPELAALAESHCLVRRTRPLLLAGVDALRKGLPVSLTAFREAALARWVEQTLRERDIGAIYVFSGQMGQYVPPSWGGRLVIDLCDVDSAKFEAYGLSHRGPKGWLHAREGRLLRAVENALVARADVTLLISAEEAALLRSLTTAKGNIRALGNGIDSAVFDPAQTSPHPELAAASGPHSVFTGQMDYPPNVDAVQRFARGILPRIRKRHADAQFHIVGRAPTAEVLKLASHPGTRVWGAVPDMRPFLAAADLVVAPLTIARGVQNKVLEAMAMACPVLLSPEAATGIPATNREHFLICTSDDEFVSQSLALLDHPAEATRLGQSAREFVATHMSWPAMLADLPAILGLAQDHRDAA